MAAKNVTELLVELRAGENAHTLMRMNQAWTAATVAAKIDFDKGRLLPSIKRWFETVLKTTAHNFRKLSGFYTKTLSVIFFVLMSSQCVSESEHRILVLCDPYPTGVIDKTIPFITKEQFAIKAIELTAKKQKEFELTNALWDIKNVHKGDTLFMSRITTRITSIHKKR